LLFLTVADFVAIPGEGTVMRIAAIVLFFLGAEACLADEPIVLQGPWKTTNRPLEGVMTCVVTPSGPEKWTGRFYGVWQGVPFDYTVAFAGPAEALHGTATVDHADYEWKGSLSAEPPRKFRGSFGGTRYAGHFELTEKLNSSARKSSN
jgi:hypothetical protein